MCVCDMHAPPHTPRVGQKSPRGGLSCDPHRLETVVVTLADTPGGPPFPLKVRRLLKAALRSHGLRCIDMRQDTQHRAAPGRNHHDV
jgi:hypothetical protein